MDSLQVVQAVGLCKLSGSARCQPVPVSLDPGVGRVRHEVEESGDHPRVELLLEDGSEVRGHLADGVTAGVPARDTSPYVTFHVIMCHPRHVTRGIT